VSINETWLRRGLGMLLIFTFVSLMIKRRLTKPENLRTALTVEDLLKRSEMVQILCVSVLTGTLFGLFSIGGPPIMLWAAIKGIEKDTCRANICASWAIMFPASVIYLLFVKKKWQNEHWPYYLMFLAGCSVGLTMGLIVSKRVSEKHFQFLLSYLILLAGGMFIGTGLNTLIKVLIVLICICVGIISGKLVMRGKDESCCKDEDLEMKNYLSDAYGVEVLERVNENLVYTNSSVNTKMNPEDDCGKMI